MKIAFPDIKADFIVDHQGNKKKVILDIEQFEELIETLEDYYDIATAALEKRDTQTCSLEELKRAILERPDEEK